MQRLFGGRLIRQYRRLGPRLVENPNPAYAVDDKRLYVLARDEPSAVVVVERIR
jgi:hypothetical protein